MTKLVLKTVAITLASVIGALALTFGALALFSPVSIAKAFDAMGGYSSAVYFYELQYNKTGSVEDLAYLTIKIDDDNDTARAEKYLAELIEHKDFSSLCQSEEQGAVSSKEFYYGEYALALAKNDKVDKAIETANAFVVTNGYTDFNPFSVLLFEYGAYLSNADLDQIKEKIQGYSLSGKELEKANVDISHIETLKD